MTVEGTSIQAVEFGLIERFQGRFEGQRLISGLIEVDGKGVDLFLEKPDPEIIFSDSGDLDRVFPSISIEFVSITPDRSRLESDEGGVVVSETATKQVLHPDPSPYAIHYRIHMFSRNVHHDRDLMQQLLASFEINDSLLVDGSYWTTTNSDIVTLDQYYERKDQNTYHKMFNMDVMVVILPENIRRTETKVSELNIQFYTDEDDFDRRIVVTETDITVSYTEL